MTAAVSPRSRGALALALWLAAMALGAWLIARAQFSADLSAFLPVSPDAQQQVLIEQLQSGVAARTLLLGIEGGSAAQRAQASRRLAASLRESGLFEQVQNGEPGDWEAAGELLFQHRYHLSPAVAPGRFTVDGLRDAIDETLSLLGTPAGSAVKPLLDRDPTGETQRIAEALIPANAPRSDNGVWVSRSAPRALLLTVTRAAGADLDAQAQAIARAHSAFAPLAAQGLSLQASGAGVFAVQSRAVIEREVKLLAAVGVIAIGGLLMLAFASLRALAVALLPVVTGIVTGVAAVSLGFGSVHGITLGFGSTLIGEAVDYAIYYLMQARPTLGSTPGTGWRRWRDENWPTVRLGLLTSVCGFAALMFSGFPGLAQLGVFSVAGLTGAALATRFVLPVLVPDGASGQGLRRPLGRLGARAVQALPRLRGVFLLLGLMAAGLLIAQGGRLWRGDLNSLSPVPRAAQELDATLRADLGANDAGTLVVASGADQETALRAAEAATQRLDALVEQGLIAGYEAPTRLLPSQAAQRARLASLPQAGELRERLAQATHDGPLNAERLAPFVDAVQAARERPVLTRASLAATPLASAVDALLFERPNGGWTALIPLQPGDTDIDPARVRQALHHVQGAASAGEIQIVAVADELNQLYSTYLREALAQALLGAVAVVVVLALHLRSRRRLLAVCQPLALAVLLTLGGLALLDVALGILHLVGLLLVVAVGSNYGLFFARLDAEDGLDDDTLASLMLANLTTVVSFGLIALSHIPALSAIGRVVAPGALLALLLAAVFSRMASPRVPLRV